MTGKRATLTLFLVSLLCAALLGEFVLRLRLGTPAHWKYPQEHYVADAELGLSLRPLQSAFTHDRRVEVNSQGLRDREYAQERPPSVRRILALGDSQTFGNGLDLGDTWPKQLERQLAARQSGFEWQVLNAGISSTDTWQHQILLTRLAGAYRFDAVILAFYVNDVTRKPRRILSDVAVTNSWSKRIGYLLKRSALFTALWQARQMSAVWVGSDWSADRERAVLTGEPDAVVEEGWAQVERSLVDMHALAEDLGVPFLLLVLPRRDQVDGSLPATGYNRRVREIASHRGIPTVDVLDTLRGAYADHGRAVFIPWDGHHSAIANDAIAQRVVDDVLALGLSARTSHTAGR